MAKPSKRADANIERRAYSIAEWCAANGIAVSTFYAAPDADKPAIIRFPGWRARYTRRPPAFE